MKKKLRLYSFLPLFLFFSGLNTNVEPFKYTFAIWFYVLRIFSYLIIPSSLIIYFIVINILNKFIKTKLKNKDIKKLTLRMGFVGIIIDYIILIIFTFMHLWYRSTYGLAVNYYEISSGQWWDGLETSVVVNPFSNIYTLILMCLVTFVFKYINYRINLKYCMNNIEIEEREKKKLALYTIMLTAPYYFLTPTEWFFK